MFSQPNYEPSNLTKDQCESLVKFLNEFYNPFLTFTTFHWNHTEVQKNDENELKFQAGSLIVYYDGPNGYLHHKGEPITLKAFNNIFESTKEYFDKTFPNKFFFQDDQFRFYITDKKLLNELKDAAVKKYGDLPKPK